MVGLGTKGMLPRASGMGRVRPNRPVITSSDTVTVNTGDQTVETVTAVSAGQVQYYIVGGADRGLFTINQGSGELSFLAPSVDGTYEVEVRAEGPGGSADQTITVTVQAAVYHADAVHFDGANVVLQTAALSCTDGNFVSGSMWLKFNGSRGSLWTVDPNGDYGTFCETDTLSTVSYVMAASGGAPSIQFSPGSVPPDNAWHHILFSAQTNLTAGNKIIKLYFDDVDMTSKVDAGASFQVAFSGLLFAMGDDLGGFGAVFDVADFWLAPNVSLLTAGDIPQATRRLFISATLKPVDPSGFPSGAILFSGDATAFPTNQGTGGAFTLTGSLTNAGTSPSD